MVELWPIAAAALAGAADSPAAPGESSVIPYPAAFFADARPNNAFDMVQRLPGFTFDPGDNEVRGFAGAVGNVLVDGERPSSKSVILEDLLRRIPASAVERIELIRGGAPGINMQGQPQVANIVRSREASSTTALTMGARAFSTGWIAPQADLEWTRRSGALALEAAAHATWEMDPESGNGRQTRRSGLGALVDDGPMRHRERGYTLQANGSAALDGGGDVFRLNLGGEREYEGTRQEVAVETAGGLAPSDLVTERRIARSLELGGDYEHAFSARTTLRVVALQTLGRQTSSERSQQPAGTATSDERRKTGESILRATLTSGLARDLTMEAGGEGAFNVLDSRNAFAEDGVAVDLPNARVRVEERRAEGFVTGFWKLSEQLSVEAGSRLEASRISQSGDTRLARSFVFAKPRAVLTYAPDGSSQLRLRVEREIGQLDFADFAASAELGGGTVTAGNAQLEPERSWVFEAAAERRFWGKGAVILTFAHAEVEKLVDLIPVEGRFDAPGNIDKARRDELKLTATLPLDRLGLRGGLLTGEVVRRWSKVTDPVTGRARRISFLPPIEGEVRFSHDVAALDSTWGIEAELAYSETEYRIAQVRRLEYGTWWTLYWDWKPRPGLSVRAEVQNLAGRDFRRIRTLYAGSRAGGRVDLVERRSVGFDPFLFLRVRAPI